MASAGRVGIFRRRPKPRPQIITVGSPGRVRGPWSMVSSAARLDVSDRQEAKVQRQLRQGWQAEAWGYRASVGELRYAVGFLANCTSRMKLYPACYPPGGEADNPVALDKVTGMPDEVISACAQAMADLGQGRMAISGMLHRLSSNKTVAGEGYLLGRTDEQTGRQKWSIRSVSEMVVESDKWWLREIPSDRQNSSVPWQELDPALTVISRIWTPDPEFELLADSPLKPMLSDLESLMILRRGIRATGRSRLARSGIFAIPEEFTIVRPADDNEDPEADDFLGGFTEAIMEPIGDEGVATAVVPIIIRGPGDSIAKIKQFDFSLAFDAEAAKTREELRGNMATALDLPREVLLGVVDLNHWAAWSVSADLFREHVEPHVIGCCDDLSGAFLRPYLAAAGIDDEWVQRIVFWYDPVELISPPDRTADAQEAHDRLVISDEAYRKEAGFTEEQAPSKAEIQVRLLEKMRTWPPNLVMAFLHQWDPTIIAPPITVAGTVPGIKPTGVDTGEEPGEPGALPALPSGAPAPAVTADPTLPKAPAPALQGPPPAERPQPAPMTASAAAPALRLSRKLQAIDADLRARLQTAANAAMRAQLQRAGARLRTKVARDETLRTKIAHRANERVSAVLGPDVVTAAGVSASELMGNDWSGLRAQFYAWTDAAQSQAIATALRIGSLDGDSAAAVKAAQAMSAGRDAGWEMLSGALTSLGHHLLYDPDPNAGPGDWGDLNPDTLVPAGTIRAALGLAGGASQTAIAASQSTGAVMLTAPVGQIGTGATVGDLISAGGGQRAGYEWAAGPALNPFQPHQDLDGARFESFDDPALANSGDFPDNAFYMPGDHDGCLCDFMPIYLSPSDSDQE